MSFYHNPRTVTNGLVLYADTYNRKSYVSGSSTMVDLAGNYNGDISGNPQLTGSYFQFDGVDDKIEWDNALWHRSDSTIECWFNIDTFQSESAGMFGYLGTAGTWSRPTVGACYVTGTLPVPLTDNAGVVASLIQDAGGLYGATYRSIETIVSKGEWHQGVLSRDMVNGTMSLYIDNELQGTIAFDVATFASWSGVGRATNDIQLGKEKGTNTGLAAPNKWFEGKTSGLKVYNRILSEEERTTNYLATKGRYMSINDVSEVVYVTESLVFHIDAANSESYPESGNDVYNLVDTTISASFRDGAAIWNNNAFQIDGANSYAVVLRDDIPDLHFDEGDFTAEVWSIGKDLSNYHFVILGLWNTGALAGTNEWFIGHHSSEALRFAIADAENTTQQVYSIASASLDTWYHTVGVRSDTTMSFYVDGQEAGPEISDPALSGSADTTNPLYIGAFRYSATVPDAAAAAVFSGSIAIVRIYQRALNSDEIRNNFSSERSRFGK